MTARESQESVRGVSLFVRRIGSGPPTVVLHGGNDGVSVSRRPDDDLTLFPPGTVRRVVDGAGHFMPREKPAEVVDALLKILG